MDWVSKYVKLPRQVLHQQFQRQALAALPVWLPDHPKGGERTSKPQLRCTNEPEQLLIHHIVEWRHMLRELFLPTIFVFWKLL